MMLEWDRTNGASGIALDNKLGIATEELLERNYDSYKKITKYTKI